MKPRPTFTELPEVLTAQNIADHLGVGRKQVYEFMQRSPKHGGIPSFNLGKSKRVEKADYGNWLEARKQEQASKFA